jgi:hypothetical protein
VNINLQTCVSGWRNVGSKGRINEARARHLRLEDFHLLPPTLPDFPLITKPSKYTTAYTQQ